MRSYLLNAHNLVRKIFQYICLTQVHYRQGYTNGINKAQLETKGKENEMHCRVWEQGIQEAIAIGQVRSKKVVCETARLQRRTGIRHYGWTEMPVKVWNLKEKEKPKKHQSERSERWLSLN